ncbi:MULTISPECIES: tetratricopeptide repeat protein [Limnochorda]|uniref:tetratricopeptide repeat protein n=1 Tax=Limnochorda TaxID=1676651 RepID=UPI001D3A8AEB|nr:tetratricopeptide repeat protein [Limnochorda pilosa]MBO2487294.1 hypothetical protein [Bacillota bacterium]MBO2519793.1 hypothetical protein [Bacillota bacterium]
MSVEELDLAAREAMDRGEPEEAERLLREALTLDPEAHPVRVNLAACLGLQNRLDEAEAELRAVLQADPTYLFPRALLATLLARAGREEEAQAEATRALSLALQEPPAPEAAEQLASALALLDDDRGLRQLAAVLEPLAGELGPETLLAFTLASRRAGGAASPFERALQRHPAAAYEPFATDLALLAQGRVEGLVHLQRRLLAAELLDEADRLAHGGRLPEAEARYQRILALVPQAVAARINLSNLYRSVGRLADAQRLLEEAARLDDHPAVQLNLAGVLVERGELAEAEGLLDRLDPQALPPRLHVLFHLVRAEARSRAGDHTGALAAWEEAARLAPDAAEVQRTRRELDRRREEFELLQFLRFYQDRRRERLERAIVRAHDLPAPPVRECLRVLTADNLRAVWKAYRTDRPPERRAEVVRLLAETVVQRLPETLASLGEAEQAVLQEVARTGGRLPLDELAQRHPTFRQDSWFWDRMAPEGPVGRLRFLQLLGFGRLHPQEEPVAFLPWEVATALS